MQSAKSPTITQELERRIRRRVYGDKLPSTRALAAEFQVARQTLTEALRPLREAGILRSGSRRGGTGIARENLPHGIIAVLSLDPEHPEVQSAVRKVLAEIAADGWEPQLLDSGRSGLRHGGLPEGTRGTLFINSALTVEMAEHLDRLAIPFVSCNQLPGYPAINVVDFDNLSSCRKLAERVVAAGYRRFGVFFSGRLEGFNDLFRSNLLHLKRRLGVPHEAYDDPVLDWQSDSDEKFRRTLEHMVRHRSYPEVLICFCSLAPESVALLKRPEFAMLGAMKVLAMPRNNTPPDPRIDHFRDVITRDEFWCRGYQLLREAIFTPGMNRVRRLLIQEFEFDVPLTNQA